MKAGEGVSEYFTRVMFTANDMRNCREDIVDVKIVEKILRSLTDKFNFIVCSIEESKDMNQLTVDELQQIYSNHAAKINGGWITQKFSKKSKWRASNKLELIHGDLCGPITPTSHRSKRYLLVLVDVFSRKTWIYFLADKSEAFETLKNFKSR